MPNPSSSSARNSTKIRESTRPVSIKSVSTEGTSTFNFSANSREIRGSRVLESGILDFPVLACQQVEQETIQGVAVDIVTLPLPPDIAKIETRSEEHTSELQSQSNLVCRLLLEKKKK